jgi:hypothetical protein
MLTEIVVKPNLKPNMKPNMSINLATNPRDVAPLKKVLTHNTSTNAARTDLNRYKLNVGNLKQK